MLLEDRKVFKSFDSLTWLDISALLSSILPHSGLSKVENAAMEALLILDNQKAAYIAFHTFKKGDTDFEVTLNVKSAYGVLDP